MTAADESDYAAGYCSELVHVGVTAGKRCYPNASQGTLRTNTASAPVPWQKPSTLQLRGAWRPRDNLEETRAAGPEEHAPVAVEIFLFTDRVGVVPVFSVVGRPLD